MVNVEDYQRYIAKVVQKIVMEYADFEFDREDLYQRGWLEFIRAEGRYDPSKGAKLTTYAYEGVERGIKEEAHFQMNRSGLTGKKYFPTSMIVSIDDAEVSEVLSELEDVEGIKELEYLDRVEGADKGEGIEKTRDAVGAEDIERAKDTDEAENIDGLVEIGRTEDIKKERELIRDIGLKRTEDIIKTNKLGTEKEIEKASDIEEAEGLRSLLTKTEWDVICMASGFHQARCSSAKKIAGELGIRELEVKRALQSARKKLGDLSNGR